MPVDFVKNKPITFKRRISVKDDDVTQLQKPINLVADLTWNSPSAGDFKEKLNLDPINIFTGRNKRHNHHFHKSLKVFISLISNGFFINSMPYIYDHMFLRM